jgi:hypothetical protein
MTLAGHFLDDLARAERRNQACALALYPSEPVQSDIYTRDAGTQRNYPEGGTDIVDNPFAPKPPPAAPLPKKKPKAAILAAGGAALLLVAVFARKRSSRSRRSR